MMHDLICVSLQGPRPSNMVIERTLDNGRTWQPALYLATDCGRTFPGVPTTAPLTLEQTHCYTLPPAGSNPYQDHTVRTHQSYLFLTANILISYNQIFKCCFK